MLIGANVSLSGDKMLLGAAEQAHTYGASTLQAYIGAPQNTRRKPIEAMRIDEGLAAMAEWQLSHLVIHAPYIINLGNTKKPENFEFAVQSMRAEVNRADAVHAYTMPFHPGAHVGAGAQAGIEQVIKGLNQVIQPDQNVTIALETMAGKGTELGRTFEELAQILDGVQHNDKVMVTLDTCHINDAGYPVVDDFDGVLNTFDHMIGLDKLAVVHLNDSKNPQGSHKDRHANIGFGTIGFEVLNRIAHHPALPAIPKILETPFVGTTKPQHPPYGIEINWLKTQQFVPAELEALMD